MSTDAAGRKVATRSAPKDLASVFKASAFSASFTICRNKHWRHISSFHGPWLQLSTDVLQSLASINYGNSRPRFVDPSLFFDLMRIRQLVDEAAELSVRAASSVVATSANNSSSGSGIRLSAERRHRIRLEAVQKLAQAYALDEIAASVATMQSTSSLEEVACLVLERAPDDRDAQYVHFFHEKIPSRHLAQSTRPEMLDRIILSNPRAPAPWRTRAMVRFFKDDFEGAVADLTESLRLARIHKAEYAHSRRNKKAAAQKSRDDVRGVDGGGPGGLMPSSVAATAKAADDPVISSSEAQLLFQRASAYMAMACQCIYACLGPEWVKYEEEKAKAQQMAKAQVQANTRLQEQAQPTAPPPPTTGSGDAAEAHLTVVSTFGAGEDEGNDKDKDDVDNDNDDDDEDGGGVLLGDEPLGNEHQGIDASSDDLQSKELLKRQLAIKRLMRQNAKRAIRDYLAFLSNYDYAPDMPIDVAETFVRRVVNTSVSRGAGGSSSWNLGHGLAIMKALKYKKDLQCHAIPLTSEEAVRDEPEITVSVYPINTLFGDAPVPNLPPYPPTDFSVVAQATAPSVATTTSNAAGPVLAAADVELPKAGDPAVKPYRYPITETATFHPLLSDALHSILLCHCLLQTPPKELIRHVNMVARLCSLSDGYPAFQSPRCTARMDWIEILRQAGGAGWVELPTSWEEYCSPFVLTANENKDMTALAKAANGLAVQDKGLSKSGGSGTGGSRGGASNGNGATNTYSLPPLPSSVSERALAISRYLLENMRTNGGVIGRPSDGGGGTTAPPPPPPPRRLNKKERSTTGGEAGSSVAP